MFVERGGGRTVVGVRGQCAGIAHGALSRSCEYGRSPEDTGLAMVIFLILWLVVFDLSTYSESERFVSC